MNNKKYNETINIQTKTEWCEDRLEKLSNAISAKMNKKIYDGLLSAWISELQFVWSIRMGEANSSFSYSETSSISETSED